MKIRDLNKAQWQHLVLGFTFYLIVSLVVLFWFCSTLYNSRIDAQSDWDGYLSDPPEQAALAQEESSDAVRVSVGTYVDNLRELNLKDSTFRVRFLVWFNWDGDASLDPANHFRIYKGVVNSYTLVKEEHQGDHHYQLVRIDVDVSKHYDTVRFPLESQDLRIYIESDYPIQEVVYEADRENSGVNRDLSLTGYKLMRDDVGVVSYQYDTSHGDPTLDGPQISSEFVTAMEINRADFGLYFKCFIALAATILWALIALFICTYHHVDPLSMLPGALFGAVGNIMIGANLLPDALHLGLMEYVNIWGVLTILGATLAIITINRERQLTHNSAYAKLYGTILFYMILILGIVGQVLLPLMAYIF